VLSDKQNTALSEDNVVSPQLPLNGQNKHELSTSTTEDTAGWNVALRNNRFRAVSSKHEQDTESQDDDTEHEPHQNSETDADHTDTLAETNTEPNEHITGSGDHFHVQSYLPQQQQQNSNVMPQKQNMEPKLDYQHRDRTETGLSASEMNDIETTQQQLYQLTRSQLLNGEQRLEDRERQLHMQQQLLEARIQEFVKRETDLDKRLSQQPAIIQVYLGIATIK